MPCNNKNSNNKQGLIDAIRRDIGAENLRMKLEYDNPKEGWLSWYKKEGKVSVNGNLQVALCFGVYCH